MITDKTKKLLVLAEYFGGWWEKKPNKWNVAERDWREDYPERIPLLGQYNSQETMDAEIEAASTRGVDGFNILWYPDTGNTPESVLLDSSLEHFMRSPNSSKMNFSIEYCNHAPFDISDEAEWRSVCSFFADCMTHPSYLRTEGRAYLKIHGLEHFRRQMNGDPEKIQRFIAILRDTARERGAGEMVISTGVMAEDFRLGKAYFDEYAGIFDVFSTYMDMPTELPVNTIHPYSLLLGKAQRAWEGFGKLGVPYIPYLPSGWDPRPWKDPRPAFAFPTREEWHGALLAIAATFEKYPSLGIPLPGGSAMPAFTIYAWNEYGEGGMIAPTRGDGWMKLEEIKMM
ncbi:MAG: glycoside hydrolase family 71/99 protein [Eubacteriales bacterium]